MRYGVSTLTTRKVFPFLQWLPLVNRVTLRFDFLAGLTGAVVVLPQGVAFAMIAGLPPVYGLYTAMVTPVVAALFGSSYHLVSGPTTTTSIAVFAAVSTLAIPGTDSFVTTALGLTMIVGLIQFSMGIARLGSLVNFVSRSVITGYTAGAAILIVTNQIKHLTGLSVPAGASFIQSWSYTFTHGQEINLTTVTLGFGTILAAVLIKKLKWSLPYFLIAMILSAVAGSLLPIVIPMVGEIPSGLPAFRIPGLSYETVTSMVPAAFAVAMLGLIEVTSISRSIAILSKQRLDSNQEFIGLGLSNIVGGMFSCYAGSGSFTRSGLNYTAGARTPMAAIFASILVMAIMMFVGPFAAYLPMATMGGIIMLVAYQLIDFHYILHLTQTSRSDAIVLVVTFISTLFLGLVFAIFSGIILSLYFYLRKTSKPKIVALAPHTINGKRKLLNTSVHSQAVCPQLEIIRIDESLFFGSVENIRSFLHDLSAVKKHILIAGSGINFIDSSGAELLLSESERLKSIGGGLYYCRLKKPVRDFLDKGFKERLGSENFFLNEQEAIAAIFLKLDKGICASCQVRVFHECQSPRS
ncbi:MAG: SulP family inorganic anion transporter [Bacteroidetes bacterium]|nr:SulP family inorganic anion transporter [Bacteroidota bacterium]